MFPEKEFGRKSESRNRLLFDLLARTDWLTIQELAHYFEKDIKTIKRDIVKLKEQNIIKRTGPDKAGHWEVIK